MLNESHHNNESHLNSEQERREQAVKERQKELQDPIKLEAILERNGAEASVVIEPAEGRTVTGDFLKILEVADGSVVIFIGDVTGKGITAAEFSVEWHAIMESEVFKKFLESKPTADDILSFIDNDPMAIRIGSQVKGGIDLTCMIFNPKSGQVEVAASGVGGIPLVCHVSGNGEVSEIKSFGVPLVSTEPETPEVREIREAAIARRIKPEEFESLFPGSSHRYVIKDGRHLDVGYVDDEGYFVEAPRKPPMPRYSDTHDSPAKISLAPTETLVICSDGIVEYNTERATFKEMLGTIRAAHMSTREISEYILSHRSPRRPWEDDDKTLVILKRGQKQINN